MIGYEPKTTINQDFLIAEGFGLKEIQETYDRIMNEWKNDHVYLTELVMILNWNLWYWDGAGPGFADEYAKLYNELWEKTDVWALGHLKGEELEYFLRTVD